MSSGQGKKLAVWRYDGPVFAQPFPASPEVGRKDGIQVMKAQRQMIHVQTHPSIAA